MMSDVEGKGRLVVAKVLRLFMNYILAVFGWREVTVFVKTGLAEQRIK